jgi:hypothetical protein
MRSLAEIARCEVDGCRYGSKLMSRACSRYDLGMLGAKCFLVYGKSTLVERMAITGPQALGNSPRLLFFRRLTPNTMRARTSMTGGRKPRVPQIVIKLLNNSWQLA